MTPRQAEFLRDRLVENLPSEHAAVVNIARALPRKQWSYRPNPKSMTALEQLYHCLDTGLWFVAMVEHGGAPEGGEGAGRANPRSQQALIDDLERIGTQVIKGLKALTPKALARAVDFYGMGKYPGITLLEWYLYHLIHHRGQLVTYLRLVKAKVPSIYGPTADVGFEEVVAQAKGC